MATVTHIVIFGFSYDYINKYYNIYFNASVLGATEIQLIIDSGVIINGVIDFKVIPAFGPTPTMEISLKNLADAYLIGSPSHTLAFDILNR